MQGVKYSNTSEHLYEDIALWEKNEGVSFFEEMPLRGNRLPVILDFGYGFGQYLFASSYAFPEGIVYGIDRNNECKKEVLEKIEQRGISNIKLIHKDADNLEGFQNDSIDLMLLYDILHGGDGRIKYMLFEEAQRIIRTGGCLSILPVHLSNWRNVILFIISGKEV